MSTAVDDTVIDLRITVNGEDWLFRNVTGNTWTLRRDANGFTDSKEGHLTIALRAEYRARVERAI